MDKIIEHWPEILSLLCTALGVVWAIRRDMAVLGNRMLAVDTRLGSVEADLKKMTDVLVALARQDERLNAMNRRLDLWQPPACSDKTT
jgi:hypothetical protein